MDVATTVETWQSLVTPHDGGALSNLLERAHADYKVVLNPVQVHDKFIDQSIVIPERFVTGRELITDGQTRLESWEVVKKRYRVVQNSSILQTAASVAAKSNNTAILYGCGTLDKGRKFFAVLSTGSINMLINDSEDIVDTYVILITSHDGSIPICYYNLDVRRCNQSVLRFSSDASFCVRKRHTPTGFEQLVSSEDVLAMRRSWTTAFPGKIKSLIDPINMSYIDSILEIEWSEKAAQTEETLSYVQDVKRSIKELVLAGHNAGKFGLSKMALFTSICEYVDFGRDIHPREAAQHSLEIDNYSHRTKVKFFQALSK